MKVAFVHDHIFYRIENKVYSPGGLPYNVWPRYLEHFEELIIMGRSGNNKDDINGMIESTGEGVYFKLHDTYQGPIDYILNNKETRKPIKDLVNQVDGCIVRLPSVLGLVTIRECIKQNKPWAVEVVACCWDSLWNYGSLKGRILAPLLYYINKYYISKSKFAIYVSKEFLQKRYPCKGVTGNASNVNIQRVNDEILLERIEKIKHLSKDRKITLGMIGSLNVDFKGHRTAIQSIGLLKENGYQIKLKCLGGGDKSRWVKFAKEIGVEQEVEFCGVLPSGKAVWEWIDKLDIFIMPSLQEGLPRAMIEAMSRGCPIIGAETGGIPELIDSEFIIRGKDYFKIAKLVEQLIEDRELMLKQAERNFYEAKKYEKTKIDKDRALFWNRFHDYMKIKYTDR